MQYRHCGRLDWKVSALGFGCMRLPTMGDAAKIDEPQATDMLHYAIDHGVNYLDTAWPYHGGNSEPWLGRALQGGFRQKVRVATKLPSWLVKERTDFDRFLNEQLIRLQTEYIDFYLLHNLRKDYWERLYSFGVLPWLEKAIAAGRIRHVGFSFHAGFGVLKEIIDAYDAWDICQIQYNYVDESYETGTQGLQYAASKGLGVVVMEPLLGGRLVQPPSAVQAIWDRAEKKRSPVDWALQWLWDKPEVSTVLSGMSSLEQVQENIVHAALSAVGSLTAQERALVGEAGDQYRAVRPIRCTGCKYCEPCPNGVQISNLFREFIQGVMGNDLEGARAAYMRMSEGERASACVQCRLCEDKCPQRISISEWMPYLQEVLGEGKPYEPADRPEL